MKAPDDGGSGGMHVLSLRVVALWGKSQKRRRHSLARAIAAMLARRGEAALDGSDGSFEAAMLLFKRCSAAVKKEQLKLSKDHSVPNR